MSDVPAIGEAKRRHGRRGPSAVTYLLLLGAAFLVLAFSTTVREKVDELFGLQRLVLAAVAFLCLHCAWLSFDATRTRERLLDLLATALRQLGAKPDLAKHADAIDVLVRAMGSAKVEARTTARTHLVRLTGQDLGDDAARWTEWWAQERAKLPSRSGGMEP